MDRPGGAAPELVAVLTEAALMYRWGSRADRRAQVAYLVEMSRRPNVELHILRFLIGPHPGMSSLISIFDFPGNEPSMVYLENDAYMQEVNTLVGVDAHVAIFNSIVGAALDPPATTAHLKLLAETLE